MPVYKNKKAKNNKWFFIVTIKGHQICRRGFRNYDEARKAEARFIHSEGWMTATMPTLLQLVEDYKKYQSTQIKDSSMYKLDSAIRNHFLNALDGDKRIDRISTEELDHWWKLTCEVVPNQANYCLSILKRMLDYASDKWLYGGRYYKLLKPRRDFSIKNPKEEKKILGLEELKLLVENAPSESWRLFILVLFFTGMRINEISALQRKCYERPRIRLFQQLYRKGGKSAWEMTSPKTKASVRDYILPVFLLDMLDSYISKEGMEDPEDFLFFSSWKGKREPMGETTARRILNKIQAKSGLEHFSFHRFRHSQATLLFQMGYTPDTIGYFLGHSDKEITKGVYIHQTEEGKKDIAERLDARLKELFSKTP